MGKISKNSKEHNWGQTPIPEALSERIDFYIGLKKRLPTYISPQEIQYILESAPLARWMEELSNK